MTCNPCLSLEIRPLRIQLLAGSLRAPLSVPQPCAIGALRCRGGLPTCRRQAAIGCIGPCSFSTSSAIG
eukprot:11366282-Karenia_brevis.AAC.1